MPVAIVSEPCSCFQLRLIFNNYSDGLLFEVLFFTKTFLQVGDNDTILELLTLILLLLAAITFTGE